MRKFGLAAQALVAILLGIAAGIFFGPLTSVVKPIGEIFVMLLQMVVLPYICLSLIHGLGSLTPHMAKNLLKRAGLPLLSLWVIIFLVIFLLSYLIPPTPFTMIEEKAGETSLTENFLNYIIPENPFYDLANNVVPAVALFGLIIGTAVMHLKQKEPLLSVVERGAKTLENIFLWLAHVAPIGIFAHIANAVGTVNFSDLIKLEFYVIAYIIVCFYITLVLLPILLKNLTRLSYEEIFRYIRRVTFFAFATGVSSIVFPFILGVMKKVSEKNNLEEEKFHASSQTMIPLGYSFAQIGNCLILFFILFLGFYFRHPFDLSEKLFLYFLTIPLSFGASPAPLSGIKFLIQELQFPKQALDLFYETLAITIHFEVLLSVASVLVFIILALFAYYGLLRIRWRRLCWQMALGLGVLAGLILFLKERIHLEDRYQHLFPTLSVTEVLVNPVDAKIITDPEDWVNFAKNNPVVSDDEAAKIFTNILSTGVIRVGYNVNNIPYCFINESGELAGYDIAYAYQLARDLDCKLEFYPIKFDELDKQIEARYYDIAMSSVIMDEVRLRNMDFTRSYADEKNILIVPKEKESEFSDYELVSQNPHLRIGASIGYKNVVERHFPKAQLVIVEGLNDLIEGKVDALVYSQISAFVWAIDHPNFAIVDYENLLGRKYFAYPVKRGAYPFLNFLNSWLYLKENQGFKEEMDRYWFKGITPKSLEPRWSVIRNVLHWVD